MLKIPAMAKNVHTRRILIRLVIAYAIAFSSIGVTAAQRLTIDPMAIAEAIPLVTKALEIDARARAREAKHAAELATLFCFAFVRVQLEPSRFAFSPIGCAQLDAP